jgi:hypothetical protein
MVSRKRLKSTEIDMSGAVGPPTSPEWTAIVRAQENAHGDTQEAFREIAPKFVLPENINDETEYPRGLRYQSIMMATYKGALGHRPIKVFRRLGAV